MTEPTGHFTPDAASYELTAYPRSAHEARDLVRETASRARWTGDVDEAVLVTSELVSNAIRHTGAIQRLHLVISPSSFLVEADDLGQNLAQPRAHMPAADASNGRGLAIVESIAEAWGVRREGPGKTIWCELSGVS